MKIGINITPLITEHKDRGIGRYTRNIIEYLRKSKLVEVVEFTNINTLEGVDLIHYPWFDFYFHTLPIVKKYPTVVTIHDVIPLIFPEFYPSGIKGKVNFILQKLALKNVDYIITDSEASKKDISNYLKIDPRKIETTLLASGKEFGKSSKELEQEIRTRFNLEDNFLLYVGDCNYIKNIPFLIEGFYRFLQNNNFPKTKLVLVGEIFLKPENELIHIELKSVKTVNELIAKYSLQSNIVRAGNVNDWELEALYKMASVYIQPSLYEGFGLPVLEALGAGTPVLSSDAGSLTEVGGNAAIYFNPKDIEDFISKLGNVMQDARLRSKMIEAGVKQAANFSWENVAYKTTEVYKRVLSKNA